MNDMNYSMIDTSGVGKVLSIYFPEVDLSFDDSRFQLTSQLARFFSTPPGQKLASQVFLPLNGVSVLYFII